MSTGCDNDQMHAELYAHFAKANAWNITEGAVDSLQRLKEEG